ncbi:MAG: chain length determinant protein tyrosine kinase EpsG [Vicinamibacterales bacterium]
MTLTNLGVPRATRTVVSWPRPARIDGSIGTILLDAGRLDAGGLESILRAQKEKSLRFGEAGMGLGLLTQDDIDFALARQFDYPYLIAGDDRISRDVVAAFKPFSPVVEQLRVLRSQLMLRWFSGEPGHKALAITSAGRREGRSFIAANLALVFSQLGARTLLVDADLRHSSQAGLFRLAQPAGLSSLLAARAGREAIVPIAPMPNLSVLPAGPAPPNPQELLGRPAFGQLLQAVAEDFDVILIDTPAARYYADADTIAARAGAAIVLARRHVTSAPDLAQLGRSVQQAGAVLVGSVLNDA